MPAQNQAKQCARFTAKVNMKILVFHLVLLFFYCFVKLKIFTRRTPCILIFKLETMAVIYWEKTFVCGLRAAIRTYNVISWRKPYGIFLQSDIFVGSEIYLSDDCGLLWDMLCLTFLCHHRNDQLSANWQGY